MIQKQLQQLGFEEEESKIYMTSLKEGPLHMKALAETVGLKRTTIYPYVKNLLDKGLLVYVTEKRRKLLKAAPLYTLETIILNEKDIVEKKQRTLEELIPKLEKYVHDEKNRTHVQFFENKRGIETFIDMIISEEQDVYWFGSFAEILSNIKSDKFFELMTWQRMDQKTTAYAISDESLLKDPRFSQGHKEDFRKMKFLKDKISVAGLVVMFGDYIGIVSTKYKMVKIVVVHDTVMSEIMKFMFMGLWDRI